MHGVVLATGILLTTSALADTTPPGNLRYAVYSRTAAELFWDRASTDTAIQLGYTVCTTRSSQAFELFWDRVEGQAYQYDVQINGEAAGSTDGTSFFIGDETVYRDGSGQLQVTLVTRNAAGMSSAQSGLALSAGGDDGKGNPPVAGNDALLSLERAGILLQQLSDLMRSNGLIEHQGTLGFMNRTAEGNYISEEVLESSGDTYTSDILYRSDCVSGGSVEHRVEWSYHAYYRHGFNASDCRIPGYRLVSGFGTYTNEYDGFDYAGNTWTGYRGAFDALVVEQGDARETMTASSIQDNMSIGQIGSSDRYNVRRYLRIKDGEYDYKQSDVDVMVRDWNLRFNRFDPETGQHAFSQLNSTFTMSASSSIRIGSRTLTGNNVY